MSMSPTSSAAMRVVVSLMTSSWTSSSPLVPRHDDGLASSGISAPVDFEDALGVSSLLADGSCGLTDGSMAGDWRLPNIKELLSLVDYEELAPALPSGHPFTNVQDDYWSSTTNARPFFEFEAWVVTFTGPFTLEGGSEPQAKTFDFFVWPVRGED